MKVVDVLVLCGKVSLGFFIRKAQLQSKESKWKRMPQTLTKNQAGLGHSQISSANRRDKGIGNQEVEASTAAHEFIQRIHISLVHVLTQKPTESTTQNSQAGSNLQPTYNPRWQKCGPTHCKPEHFRGQFFGHLNCSILKHKLCS